MINEIPFPIPFSVIRSPSHMINNVPATIIKVEVNIKKAGEIISGLEYAIIAPGACVFKLIR